MSMSASKIAIERYESHYRISLGRFQHFLVVKISLEWDIPETAPAIPGTASIFFISVSRS